MFPSEGDAMTAGSDQTLERATEVPAYRPFSVEVLRTRRLSPSFVRVTFGGEELSDFADEGFDQRIKVVFPLPDGGFTPSAAATTGTGAGVRSPRSCRTRSAPTPCAPYDRSGASSTSTSCSTARPVPPPGGRSAPPPATGSW